MNQRKGHRILLGGIGGDSHSVGLHILHQALVANGYQVRFLGIQNDLRAILGQAGEFDVVMISNMDGHAQQYLKDFPELHLAAGRPRPLWYLGGNITIGEAEGWREHFERLGFDRVYPKFVDLNTILQTLAEDLRQVAPRPAARVRGGLAASLAAARDEVLYSWARGGGARDLADNAAFLRDRPSLPRVLAEVAASSRPIAVQPRCGVPLVDRQIELFHALTEAGADVVSYQVDSLTRNNNYQGAAEAIVASERQGRAAINGFPVVNHGAAALRRMARAVTLPLQTRHSTRDPRLLAEISFAGGVTGFEGGAICYNIPYYKDYPLRDAIERWRYVDRLTAHYHERYGLLLDREYFGTLTATLLPPSIALAADLLEAALSAEEGVGCVSLGYAEQGHRVQDIAAVRTLAALGPEFLASLGHRDVAVHTVFHQYMAAFPSSERKAEEMIFGSAVSAVLSGATRLLTKTPAESRKIPTTADNLRGLQLSHLGVAAARGLPPAGLPDEAQIAAEAARLRRETQAILDSVLDCCGGDVGAGIVRGFELGLLDIPFAPSIHNRGLVSAARDLTGAVRFLATGNLRFDAETRDFHAAAMAERREAAGLASSRTDYLLVEADVLQIARERYNRWPLDATGGAEKELSAAATGPAVAGASRATG